MSEAAPPFQLTTAEFAEAKRVLRAWLPAGSRVWVYGSRARGQARRTSDLDLAIDTGAVIEFSDLGFLLDAFDESALPFRVDVTDVRCVDAAFLERIRKEWTPWFLSD